MSKKKDIDLLIKRIKASTGLNQEGIADKINYSRPHFSILKKESPGELYDLLEVHFKDVLENTYTLDDGIEYIKKTKELNPERALIDMLILEVAKLKSKIYGMSVSDAIDELEQNAKITLRQLEKKS